MVEGKTKKVDLCETCSKAKGVDDPTGFSLADLLLGLGAAQEMEQAAGAELNARIVALRRLISRKPAGWDAPNVMRRLEKAWRVCSKPCTRVPSTWKSAPNAQAKPGFVRKAQRAAKEMEKAISDEDSKRRPL